MARGKKVLKLRAQAKVFINLSKDFILFPISIAQKFTFKYEGVSQPEGVKGRYYPADDVKTKKGSIILVYY